MERFLIKKTKRNISDMDADGSKETKRLPSSTENTKDCGTSTHSSSIKPANLNKTTIIQNVENRSFSDIYLTPNQPKHSQNLLPRQELNTKTLTFQEKWYKEFPWLHVVPGISGIVCFYCKKFVNTCPQKNLAKRSEPAFTETGFKNWKKALERFKTHEKCDAHLQAVLTHNQASNSVDAQLKTGNNAERDTAFRCLVKILRCVRFLGRQGISFRGHTSDSGNFKKILELKSEDDSELKSWISRKTDWTSPHIQNEILQIMSNDILRTMVSCIHKQKNFIYSVMCDGTRDISGQEQISISLRYVDESLKPLEIFVGLYVVSSTTGEYLYKEIFDVLVRLQLPLAKLRGQAYDGAANMSGHNAGLQAKIKEKQPLAIFVHCGVHSANLVINDAYDASSTVRNSLQWAHDLGVLLNQSLNARQELRQKMEANADGPVANIVSIKPLCPTRWIYRGSQVNNILNNYNLILETLEELSRNKNSHACGLLQKFENSETVLGLLMAKQIIEQLEMLIKALQARQQTVMGTMKVLSLVTENIVASRSEVEFKKIFEAATEFSENFYLIPLELPRKRKPPKRLSGPGESYEANSVVEHYRSEYYMMIDSSISGLRNRFNQEGIERILRLEKCLLEGVFCDELNEYPEIDVEMLKSEIKLFRNKFHFKSVKEAIQSLLRCSSDVRELFSNVEMLLRLLIVVPSSTCEAERSFSSLRRLKTYLRSTMSQPRLNHVAVLHVHQDEIDQLDLKEIAKIFIGENERRCNVFGRRN